MKIVVAGGGYAGLACLGELRNRFKDAALHLYDPAAHHLKITHLHETVRRPRSSFQVSFADLAARMNFEHHRHALTWEDGVVSANGHDIDFDFLAVTTGAAPPRLEKPDYCFDRDDLCQLDTKQIVSDFVADTCRPRVVNVVGAGATGIQFLFELSDRLSREARDVRLRLIDAAASPLIEQPEAIGTYVLGKMERAGIDYRPGCFYRGGGDAHIEIESAHGNKRTDLDSGLCFLFPGVKPQPQAFEVNAQGHIGGYENQFAAGDCAVYDSRGDDAMTAQIAVRQGKHVARNIDRESRGIEPLDYFFRELGYVVSLGSADAAGWMLHKGKVITGLGAFAIKEAIEAQYDLYIAGVDTYII